MGGAVARDFCANVVFDEEKATRFEGIGVSKQQTMKALLFALSPLSHVGTFDSTRIARHFPTRGDRSRLNFFIGTIFCL